MTKKNESNNNNAKVAKKKKMSKNLNLQESQYNGRDFSAPVARFREFQNRFSVSAVQKGRGASQSVLVKGQDYIGSCVVLDATLPGTNVFNVVLNPQSTIFDNTRLSRFATIFEKFCFTKIKFNVSTNAPTSFSGSYILAYDRDAGDATPVPGDAAIKSYMGMAGSRMVSIWEPNSITCPLSDTQDFFYTSQEVDGSGNGVSPYIGDVRLSSQGQIYLSTGFGNTSFGGGAVSLGLWIEYECLLMDPTTEAKPQVMTAMNDATFVTNATANNGFSGIVPTGNSQNGIPCNFQTDAAGKTFLSLPSGYFQFEQYITNATAATALLASTLVPYVVNAGYAITNIQNQGAGIAGNGWRVELLEIPFGGGRLYITWTVATTIANYLLRLESAVRPFA